MGGMSHAAAIADAIRVIVTTLLRILQKKRCEKE